MGFKKDFMWGLAASAYQIEGAAYEDGKGLGVWDAFCAEPGRIFQGHTGDVSSDHYHRYKEDVALMKELGVKAYRFSVSWTRIMPEGRGRVNPKGIEFYNKLINELIANGIEPILTLYHWDLPYELHMRGGWMNPDIVEWFGEYAKVLSENFSDRVKWWLTMNEPQCLVGDCYLSGVFAPGHKSMLRDTFLMAHHVLMAHGRAVQQIRAVAKQPVKIGYAPTCSMVYPSTESPEDIEAARKSLFSMFSPDDNWTWNVAWFSDPVFLGCYPEEGLVKYEKYLPHIKDEDLKLISQPLDYMGENIYNGAEIRCGKDGNPELVSRPVGAPKTACGWPVTPKALYWGPRFISERYKLPLMITENGLSCHDVVSSDGRVHDPNRIDFLEAYIGQLKRCADSGYDIIGYLHWSMTDNFEWARGYSERFGMIYVDFETQKRTIKDSGYWYKKIIEENGNGLKY